MDETGISCGMPELQLETLREIQIRIERESRESLREIGTLLVHGRNRESRGIRMLIGSPGTGYHPAEELCENCKLPFRVCECCDECGNTCSDYCEHDG